MDANAQAEGSITEPGPEPMYGPAAYRSTQGRIGCVVVVASLPAGLLAAGWLHVDAALVFAGLWVLAAVSQVPLGRWSGDWPARMGLVAYVIAFALPAVLSTPATHVSDHTLPGYQVFALPAGSPSDWMARFDSFQGMPIASGAWLANPLFLLGLGLYRHREATLALAVSAGALLLGLPMLARVSPGVGCAAWLAGPAFLAIASTRARSYW